MLFLAAVNELLLKTCDFSFTPKVVKKSGPNTSTATKADVICKALKHSVYRLSSQRTVTLDFSSITFPFAENKKRWMQMKVLMPTLILET